MLDRIAVIKNVDLQSKVDYSAYIDCVMFISWINFRLKDFENIFIEDEIDMTFLRRFVSSGECCYH